MISRRVSRADESRPGAGRENLLEVAALFLKLGFTAFGGPAAHIGMMHDEVVKRRNWLTEQEYLDALGATNLIPGPNSTEMAIHIGLRRAGWPGFLLAGMGFILPAVVMVLALAWAYVRFGTRPEAAWLLYGIKPAVIAIIVQALWRLGRNALRTWPLALLAMVVVGLYALRVNEIVLLFAGGLTLHAGCQQFAASPHAPNHAGCLDGGACARCCRRGSGADHSPAVVPDLPKDWRRCCTAAAMSCWHSCAQISWCALPGLRTNSCWMLSPSGR